MAQFRHEQRQITHRGRVFHFVSYEAHDAIPSRKVPAMPATWYLVSMNNRWPAIPLEDGQAPAELDAQLTAWLEQHVFAA
jgi:hypothetical protein